MRKLLRSVVIGLLVATMSFNPASAWNWFGGGGCGYGGYGGYGGYYSGFSSWGHGGGGWGHRYASYGNGSSYCGSGYSTAGDDCYGGCGSCGGYYSGYDSYGGYAAHDSCGCGSSHYDGEVIYDGGVVESYDHGTMAPIETTTPSRTVPAPRQPADSQRPMDTTPVPELPEEPMPGTETAPPAEEPDDLFGTGTEPTTTPPADTTPPAEEPADDIFGTPPAESTTPPADTGTTPPESTPPDTSVDDLFGTSDTTESTPPAGTESTLPAEGTTPPTGEEESTDAGEDIFGTGSSFDILREPGGLASGEMRTWVDNTGKYSCHGRLIRFLDNHVRLLKDNGRTATVSLSRLSATDLQFVYRQASAQQAEAASQLAHSLSPMPLLAY